MSLQPGPQPELTGGDVRLRPWLPGDGDPIGRGADGELSRRLGLPPPPWPVGMLDARAARWAQDWAARERAGFVVETGGVVRGFVEVRFHDAGHRGELTWALLPSARGHGVARRSVTLLLDWAFARGLQRAEAWVEPDNTASLRVAAACGLRREGLSRQRQVISGRARDLVLLSRLRSDVDPALDPLPTVASSFARVAQAAGLLVRDTAGRVLMLRTTYKTPWEVPGGMVETGEDLVAAAVREGREELGVDLPVGDLLLLDHRLSGFPRVLALLDGGTHSPGLLERLVLDPGEIASAHWCTRAEVERHAVPGVGERVLVVLDALASGRLPGPTVLLRDGVAPGAD